MGNGDRQCGCPRALCGGRKGGEATEDLDTIDPEFALRLVVVDQANGTPARLVTRARERANEHPPTITGTKDEKRPLTWIHEPCPVVRRPDDHPEGEHRRQRQEARDDGHRVGNDPIWEGDIRKGQGGGGDAGCTGNIHHLFKGGAGMPDLVRPQEIAQCQVQSDGSHRKNQCAPPKDAADIEVVAQQQARVRRCDPGQGVRTCPLPRRTPTSGIRASGKPHGSSFQAW